MTEKPFVMTIMIPGMDEAEIWRQFRRFDREFSPSRIEICVGSEKGFSLATVEFPPTEEGRRNFEAYQKMRFGKVLVKSSSAEKEPPERDGAIGLHGTFSQGGKN